MEKNDTNIETSYLNLEKLQTKNVGMKTSDLSTHINIAELPDTFNEEEKKKKERQQKKIRLGIFHTDEYEDEQNYEGQGFSKEELEKNSRSKNATRFNPNINEGLNDEQVAKRLVEGFTNDNQKRYSKTYSQIFLSNIFTFFNILCIGVAIALIAVKSYNNLTFLIILICNTIIGIVQEIKAKKTIDKLTLVTAPTTAVIRNSLEKDISVKDLVLDDIIKLKNGKQIPADSIVISGDIEVNEALLTGESNNIKKSVGDSLYAGSFVTSGSCIAKIDRVGQDCYVQKLQARAKRYSKPKSELLRSLRIITTFITIIIVPLGTITAIRNYNTAKTSAYSPTFSSSGSLIVYGLSADNRPSELANIGEDQNYVVPELEPSAPYTLMSTNLEIPDISQLQISYDTKVAGNISISSIEVTIYKSDEAPIITTYEAKDINALNAGRYEDGTIKLANDGDYITISLAEKTNSFSAKIYLCSRGLGYDNSEDQTEIDSEIIAKTIKKTAGSLIGMIPAGLFLLVTIALAVSVVKLSKNQTLVQELYCIEMLARVNCICLDKTGTITDGTMKVKDIIDIASINPEEPKVDFIMAAFLGAVNDNNLTSIALQDRFGVNFEYKKNKVLPFSSSRKFSAVTFDDKGTYVLGAPEIVYQGKSKKIASIVAKKASMGYRVLMLAHSEKEIVDDKLPSPCTPLAIITLEDHIRENAIETIKWFKDNGVEIKIISGDNPATVAEIANKVGVENADSYISLDGLSPNEVETVANEYTVFGRVSPDQKAIIVRSLKKAGKTVAMTGDGVNDILAMKESDCSIAMANGSEAARNVAHLVLLDSNFANMTKVVLEGRRVVNNIQSSASLYLMKTIFVMAITLLTILAKNLFTDGYPFEPTQFLLLEMFVIGLPSTILALQPNKELIKGSFITNVLSNCFAQAFCLVITVLVFYIASSKAIPGVDLSNYNELNSMCIIAITYVGLIILFSACRPLNTLRAAVAIGSAILISCSIFIPEIANNLGITYLFKDLDLIKKLFVLTVILAIWPIERGLSDLILKIKKSSKS